MTDSEYEALGRILASAGVVHHYCKPYRVEYFKIKGDAGYLPGDIDFPDKEVRMWQRIALAKWFLAGSPTK